MISFLLALINPVSAITKGIIEWQSKKLDATTEQQRIEADENIKTLQARRDVLVAEAAAGSTVNMWMRVWLSIPAGVILWKLEVWDRTLGWGVTDKLSVEEWAYISVVTGFYLLNRIVQIVKR